MSETSERSKAGWGLKHFVMAGVSAALVFAAAFALGSGLILATGIPATGGIANIFVAVLLLIVAVRIVPKFGFATLTLGLVFTFAIPTIVGGPPGAYKIVIGVLIGLTADLVLAIGRRTRTAHIVAGGLGAVVSIVSIYFALVLLSLPGADKLASLVLPLAGVQAILGALAAWAGLSLYEKRLSQLASVKRLQAEPPSDPPRA